MIYDCFMFLNELDLLEIRLGELYDFVDKFVLVETNYTHQGNKKPYYYDENKSRFSDFNDKIIHLKIDYKSHLYKSDDTQNHYLPPWVNDHNQRNMIMRGLEECNYSDWILMSDVDEIPHRHIIQWVYEGKDIKDTYHGKIGVMQMRHHWYHLNTYLPLKIWYGTRICRYSMLSDFSIVDIRGDLHPFEDRRIDIGSPQGPSGEEIIMIENAGNHFTWQISAENMLKKWHSFARVTEEYEPFKDLTDEERLSYIKERIEKGIPLFHDGEWTGHQKKMITVPIDNPYYPDYIKNNPNRFKHMIKEI